MSDIIKKPYEISIWEDVLTTKYYSTTSGAETSYKDAFLYCAAYVENTDPYSSEQTYYILVSTQVNDVINYSFLEVEITEFEEGVTYYISAPGHAKVFDDEFNTILYYDEEKVMVIGSDTMDTPTRAFEPSLKRNTNGTVTLSFYIYLRYYDEETDEFKFNPYTSYLVNERKLKLKYGDQWDEDTSSWKTAWYDCIIKDVLENSSGETITITTADMHINELSKTGFNIILDTEVGNNIGTIGLLAQVAVDGTDWEIDEVDHFKERLEEPLYEAYLAEGKLLTLESLEEVPQTEILLPGRKFYIFYSSVQDVEDGLSKEIQILYSTDATYNNRDGLIILDNNDDSSYPVKQWTTTVTVNESATGERTIDELLSCVISTDSRGKKLIKSTNCKYDPVSGKVVTIYEHSFTGYEPFTGTSTEWTTLKNEGKIFEIGEESSTFELTTDTTFDSDKTYYVYISNETREAYGYTDTTYSASTIVTNLVSNGESFPNDEYWVSTNSSTSITQSLYPPLSDPNFSAETFHDYLRLDGTGWVLNQGLVSNLTEYTGFAKGDKYVFRISYGKSETNSHGVAEYEPTRSSIVEGEGIRAIVRDYKILSDGTYKYGNTYFSFPVPTEELSYPAYDGDKSCVFVYSTSMCVTALSYSKFLSGLRDRSDGDTIGWNVGLFIKATEPGNGYDYYIESCQLFPYQLDALSRIIIPGMAPSATTSTIYSYYDSPDITGAQTAEDIDYIYQGPDILSEFTEVRQTGVEKFEKTRTVTAKESNRFNIILSLCETFECWARFNIERDEDTGKIALELLKDEDDIPYAIRQKKSISFKEYVGRDNYAGFKYGINLTSIQRSLDSSSIVTKLIVKANSNENATNGLCDISRATDNPIMSDFILNMNYYIQLGMLSYTEWIADLYSTTNGHLGFYKQLRAWNLNNLEQLLEKSSLNRQIDNLTAKEEVFSMLVEESLSGKEDALNMLYEYFCYTTSDKTEAEILLIAKQRIEDNDDSFAEEYLTQYRTYERNIDYYSPIVAEYEDEIEDAQAQILEIEEEMEEEALEKEELSAKFYSKYSRFIQEGSWISEDYVDDDLYYLDATSVLYDSAFPQVSYTISVIEISEVEGFEGYRYCIGDKTTIEDVDFFGYDPSQSTPTPYQEEVLISETMDYLDSPEKNTITVLNYKTQFEDLFQRITATTQSLQYASGEYARSASTVETDGTISATVIQNSVTQNSINLSNAKNQSTVLGDDGLTTTNLTNPLEVLRLTSGGLYVSADGGSTYTSGITASGINTSLLTAGKINVDEINLYCGTFPTFKWNKNGISAYEFSNHSTSSYAVNYGRFVRFDQYGVYGIQDVSQDNWVASGISDIEKTAQFGLIWGEFFMKSDNHGGMVKISSTEDILILSQGFVLFTGSIFDSSTTYFTKDDNGYYYVTTDTTPQTGVTYYTLGSSSERVKIGCLDLANDLYGIRIKDSSGNTVMVTGSDGNLWLLNMLTVGDPTLGATTYIGYNPDTTLTRLTTRDEYRETQDRTQTTVTYYKIESIDISDEASHLEKIEENSNEYYKEKFPPYTSGVQYYKATALSLDEVPSAEKVFLKSSVAYDTGAHQIIKAGVDGSNEQLIVYEDGYISAKGGTFTGEINATSGSIGGINVEQLGDSLAKLNLYDSFISMVVGNANYSFTKDALNIYNAGLNIYSKSYSLYNGTPSDTDTTTYYTESTVEGVTTYTAAEPPYSSGVEYYTAVYTKALYTETNSSGTEDLHMSGVIYASDGEFSGVIRARDSYFSGTINATDGTLKNMTISGLLSVGDSSSTHINIDGGNGVISSSNYSDGGNEGFYIGSDGAIVANNITLGSSKMKKYINLGNDTWIFNTELTQSDLADDADALAAYTTDGDAIAIWNGSGTDRVKTIQINQEGYINVAGAGKIDVGNFASGSGIRLDAAKESISSGSFSYLGTEGWYIDNLQAIFNDISARGSIKASILEYGSVLAVGGIMLVRPSTRVVGTGVVTFTSFTYDPTLYDPNVTYYEKTDLFYEVIGKDDMESGETYYTVTYADSEDEAVINSVRVENTLGFNAKDWCIVGDPDVDNMVNATANPDSEDLGLSRTAYQVSAVIYDKVGRDGNPPDGSGYIIFNKSMTRDTIDDYASGGATINDYANALIGGGSDIVELTLKEMVNLPLISMITKEDTDDENAVGLALNSSRNDHFVPATSFSVFLSELLRAKYAIEPDYKIILGKLPNTKQFEEKILPSYVGETYGLYAENAILSGSLVTIDNTRGYIAGINTLSTITWKQSDALKYFPSAWAKSETGPIILWAGLGNNSGQSSETNTVLDAAFKLDTYGNLFAGSAYFKGTIISDATITAAELRSAVIRGWDIKDGEREMVGGSVAGLEIKDIEKGIKFTQSHYTAFTGTSSEWAELKSDNAIFEYYSNSGTYKTTLDSTYSSSKTYYIVGSETTNFELAQTGINISDLPMQSDNMIIAKRIYGYEANSVSSAMGANRIGFIDTLTTEPTIDASYLASIRYDSSLGSMVFNTEDKDILRIDKNQTSINNIEQFLLESGATTVNTTDYYLGSGDSTLHYQKVSEGYNLFVGV